MWLMEVIKYLLALWLGYSCLRALYNLILHPLSTFPGPRLWAAFRLPWCVSTLRGRIHRDLKQLHDTYGPFVRVAPNELSVIDPRAWHDLYAPQNSRKSIKDPDSYGEPDHDSNHIVVANSRDHARFRRCLLPAFSEKALKAQMPLIESHVDHFVRRMKERAGKPVDMVLWYNYLTFDIIGDLAFGSDFGCLASSDYHPWVALVMGALQWIVVGTVTLRYIPKTWLTAVVPDRLMQKKKDHDAMTRQKVLQRLEANTNRADFLSYILRHDSEDGKGMDEAELMSNSSVLIFAGSETTSTAMAGITYLLLKNPDVLTRLNDEIRRGFVTEKELTLETLADCEYLNAVIREGMRVYPPVAGMSVRKIIADGVMVAGRVIPKGTVIGIPQWATNRSASLFTDPNRFDPSRWLSNEKPATGTQTDSKHTPQAVNPFMVGSRNCIAQNLAWMEMRLILSRVIWNFDLELLNDGFRIERQKVLPLWDKPPLSVMLTPRAA